MNQILYMNLEIEINGNHFRLSLPVGSPWKDALEAIKVLGEKAFEIAQKTMESAAQPIKQEANGASSEVSNGSSEQH